VKEAIFVVVGTLLLLAIVVWGVRAVDRRYSVGSEMYEKCINDGNKDYECYGMMYGGRRRR
jgi:hypothetical protein